MFHKKSPLEREWNAFLKREEKAVKRYGKTREAFWEKKLRAVVPENLREKLETAFYKAFQTILQSGTGIIEKTYSREKLEKEYKIREYSHKLQATRKSLTAGRRTAEKQTMMNVAGAGVEGAALGLLGIGLPDIPLFLGVVLRSLYTLALHFGIDYTKPEEQELLLDLLSLSLYGGEGFGNLDAQMNRRLYEAAVRDAAGEAAKTREKSEEVQLHRTLEQEKIRAAARALSGELLYMKFLQGIPVAGIIGGIYDGIYLKKITDYASLKLERRYLLGRV